MDGLKRIQNFRHYTYSSDYQPRRNLDQDTREFKTSTFIPAEPKYLLSLKIINSPANDWNHLQVSRKSPPGSPHLPTLELPVQSSGMTSRMSEVSLSSLAFVDPPPPPSLTLSNPTQQATKRVVSFIKYVLRCNGIVYHALEQSETFAIDKLTFALNSVLNTNPETLITAPPSESSQSTTSSSDNDNENLNDRNHYNESMSTTTDNQTSTFDERAPVYLRCVLTLEDDSSLSKATNALRIAMNRPKLLRSATENLRSSSTPPIRDAALKKDDKPIQCLVFWLCITPIFPPFDPTLSTPKLNGKRHRSKSRRHHSKPRSTSKHPVTPPEFRVAVSDPRALGYVRKALDVTRTQSSTACDDEGTDEIRGRSVKEKVKTVTKDRSITPRPVDTIHRAHSSLNPSKVKPLLSHSKSEQQITVTEALPVPT